MSGRFCVVMAGHRRKDGCGIQHRRVCRRLVAYRGGCTGTSLLVIDIADIADIDAAEVAVPISP